MDQAEQLRALVKQQAAQEKKEQEIKNPSNKKLANVITITSGKGGVGKTTLTINIAYTLAMHFKKSVLVIDMDPQFNATQALMTKFKSIDEYQKLREKNKTIAS